MENLLAERLLRFAEHAKTFAFAPVSNFHVGAAVQSEKDGKVYLGFNVEFPNQPLSATLHAEISAATLALNHGENGVLHIAVTEVPCGHCRQMIGELCKDTQVYFVLRDKDSGKPKTLKLFGELVTSPVTSSLLSSSSSSSSSSATSKTKCVHVLEVKTGYQMTRTSEVNDTLAAALALSKAPYSKSPSACLFTGKDDQELCTGSYFESVAFNPSIPPFQSCFVSFGSSVYKLVYDLSEEATPQARVADLFVHFIETVHIITLVEETDAKISQIAHIKTLLQGHNIVDGSSTLQAVKVVSNSKRKRANLQRSLWNEGVFGPFRKKIQKDSHVNSSASGKGPKKKRRCIVCCEKCCKATPLPHTEAVPSRLGNRTVYGCHQCAMHANEHDSVTADRIPFCEKKRFASSTDPAHAPYKDLTCFEIHHSAMTYPVLPCTKSEINRTLASTLTHAASTFDEVSSSGDEN